ncbi:ADP-ribosylation factor 1 [Vitis vinifera]|uniref:ADP-ribosylation factor 1 n=1 Tax=Vitis vinifera TaxID=29760 RepID=A0A438H5G1_VITVI|nr:ADP-ribosylation factor 1 [Vitis vinifera]
MAISDTVYIVCWYRWANKYQSPRCLRQGYPLSPCPFLLVMKISSRRCRQGYPLSPSPLFVGDESSKLFHLQDRGWWSWEKGGSGMKTSLLFLNVENSEVLATMLGGKAILEMLFSNTQAIIYVVDSSDTDRLVIAKDEFHAILQEEELKGAVVLIFANKQDLPGALDDAAVTEALELHKIKKPSMGNF